MFDARARRPYPPVITDIEGQGVAPASLVNLDPITVTWKRRDHRKATISLPSDPTETVEAGTQYFVRFGPPEFSETLLLGDASADGGEFNLSFKGYNTVEFFAEFDGRESTSFKFNTNAVNGNGASVAGALPSIAVVMDLTATVGVEVVVPLPEVVVGMVEPGGIEIEDMPVLALSAPEGEPVVSPEATEIGEVSLVPPEAVAGGGVTVASGTITASLTAPFATAEAVIEEVPVGASSYANVGQAPIQLVVPAGMTQISAKLWGGGGGGNKNATSGARAGGHAGYSFARNIPVVEGDVVEMYIATGGKEGTTGTGGGGGLGGWPGGGEGGIHGGGAGGGGGGYSAILINGVIKALAAGGGGGGGNDTGRAGPGGGEYGVNAYWLAVTESGYVRGASQVEPGDSTSSPGLAYRGASLQGGRGWITGDRFTNVSANGGGGGGGGLYGGGGGDSGHCASGGSSLYPTPTTPDYVLQTEAGSRNFEDGPGGRTDPNYPGAPVGMGGAGGGSSATPTEGGGGAVWLWGGYLAPDGAARMTQEHVTVFSQSPSQVRMTQEHATVFSKDDGQIQVTQTYVTVISSVT